METVAQVLAAAVQRLAASSDSPRFDAELLLAHALGLTRAGLIARLNDPCDASRFKDFVSRRADGEPVAYILGEWEFYSLAIEVEPPVLVPRPETEHLVEAVLEFIGDRPAQVLDLCTGTGCVAVAIAANAPHARVTAADINPRYVALAQRNASRRGVADRIEAVRSDLFDGLPAGRSRFDAICANPPYVAEKDWASLSRTIRNYEDPAALLAGPDGLDFVRRIAAEAPRYLRRGGLLAIEIGQGQADAVRGIFAEAGLESISIRPDLAGIARIACGRLTI